MKKPSTVDDKPTKVGRFAVRLPKTRRPRAVVIAFGWTGATRRNLDAYARVYASVGCATVSSTMHPAAAAVSSKTAARSLASEGMRVAADLIRRFEAGEDPNDDGNPNEPSDDVVRIPVIVHAMCNAGGFCRLAVHEEIAVAARRVDTEDAALIGERLSCEVLDSCPVYVSTRTSYAALRGMGGINPLAFWTIMVVFTVANYLKYFLTALTDPEPFDRAYWNGMLASDACPHQFLAYSEADAVCDHRLVDDFVAFRRDRASSASAKSGGGDGGRTVGAIKFEGTGHCRHLQGHRKEYEDMIGDAVDRAVAEMRKRKGGGGGADEEPQRSRL